MIVSTIGCAVVRVDSSASAAFWKGLQAMGALNVPRLPISISSVMMKWPVPATETAVAKTEQPRYRACRVIMGELKEVCRSIPLEGGSVHAGAPGLADSLLRECEAIGREF
jgi:hypothetical protein